ncbi:MAG: rhomboid family intramembrane serine protease [Sedimentisphaerales bacterium]|nr:rhomboid family intramembrane serine protease [Sedimentisphaerales bacterium]
MRIIHGRTTSPQDVPFGNCVLMLLASTTFMLQFLFDDKQQYLSGLILQNWSFLGIVGHLWLHTGLIHITSNLVVLWIFGRHVCQRMGNANYILAYFIVGLASAAVHIVYDGRPAIGASGAIMGILGLYVVLCFKRFGVLGPWIILVWYLLNVAGGVLQATPAAHMAHVGGFLGGIILAWSLVILNVVEREEQPVPVLNRQALGVQH